MGLREHRSFLWFQDLNVKRFLPHMYTLLLISDALL